MKQVGQNSHRWVLVGVVAAGLSYGVLFPLLQNLIANLVEQPAISKVEPQSVWEIINQRLIEGLFAGLFFSFGAAVGSFLNVVAYRMPLNRSIVSEPSMCPKCRRRISARDNFPVFGWFMLGGKCRNCGLPISPRYPLVEAIAGTIFLIFFFRELISGGANLPIKELSIYKGVVWIILYVKWDLLAIYAYHCAWLFLLLVWALFAWDGNRVPVRAFLFGIFALVMPPLLLTYLVQVPADFFDGHLHWSLSNWAKTALTLAIGAAAGLALAVISRTLLIESLDGFSAAEPGAEPASPPALPHSLPPTLPEWGSDVSRLVSRLESTVSVNSEQTDQPLAGPEPLTEVVDQPVGDLVPISAEHVTDDHSLATPTVRPSPSEVLQDSLFACLICTGIAVGWQALVAITLMTLAYRVLCWLSRSERIWNALPFAGWFLVLSLTHHFFWRNLIKLW